MGFVNLDNVSDENQETPLEDTTTQALSDPVIEEGLAEKLAAVAAERDQLGAEKADLTDRLLRRQAEFENLRRRAERDRLEFVQYAGAEIMRDILPAVDDFERALKVESADAEYRRGVELIYQRLLEALKKAGLEPMECAGKPFDPNLHQAVDRKETEEVEDQTILEEYQRGYSFRGKLLRPAMVKVAVRPS
ncbi:MAG: nucleotide exchange factor GrpE [Acidobacteria bacterium]|nr:nucleotide exchange factor GrpE [Acidobacteriota bacterium]